MSGIEIFSLIAAIIGVTDTIIEVYDAIKDLHGLPEAFQEVNNRLPLVKQILEDAKVQAKNAESVGEVRPLKTLLDSCKEKADKLLEIFKKIAEKSKDEFVISVYQSLIVKLGKKHRVETLMDNILKDLGVLTAHSIFQVATQNQVESLEKARQELASVPPSLPDSDFDEKLSAASQVGDRNHQYNLFGSGTQKNVSGNNYEAARDMNFVEPLSVAASIAGLPAAGNEVASLLTTKRKDSPALAGSIMGEVAGISDALGRIQDFVSGHTKAADDRGNQILLDQLLTTLTGCVMTYSDLQNVLTNLKISEDTGMSDRTNTLVERLHSYKLSLTLMLTIMQCKSIEEAQRCAEKLCVLVEQLLESYPDLAERMQGLEHEGSIISKARSEIIPGDDASMIRRASATRESMLQPGDTPLKRLTFEDDLESSNVYKRASYRYSQLSISSTALYTTALSVFSKLSLSQVSSISFYALPVCAVDLNNSSFYVFGEEGAVVLDLPATPTARREDQDCKSPANNKPAAKSAFSGVASPVAKSKRSSLLGRFATLQRRVQVSAPELGSGLELLGSSINAMERLYRGVRVQHETKITRVVCYPQDVVEIQFVEPSFKYKAGQWLFLQLPSVSKHQWHPFTITTCPYDPYISVHVRLVDDFTRALGDAVGASPGHHKLYESLGPMGVYEVVLQNGQQMPALRIGGPYGTPADVFENDIAVLIGAGIGVIAWAGILKNIWHLCHDPTRLARLRRVEFMWVCKNASSIEWFQALLSALESQDEVAQFLKIHIYLTQKMDIDTTANIVLNTVGSNVDPITGLMSRTNFGRPDFTRLFTGMRDGILDQTYTKGLKISMKTTVGVYFCGPSAAALSIKKACKAATVKEVNFRFWKEDF